MRTYQATLLQMEGADEPRRRRAPGTPCPGRGAVRVILRRSLAEELSGVRD